MKKIAFTLALSALLLGGLTLLTQNSTIQEPQVEDHPGWFDHYLELKGDKNGNIPSGLVSKWMKADKEKRVFHKNGFENLENLKEVGPFNVGGRTRSIVIDHSNPKRLICAGVSGGIWVSKDDGESWNIVDEYAPTLSATSITQSPFDKDLFYYGTGEPLGNSADLGGLGLFRSNDGAKSFEYLEHTDVASLRGIWDVQHSLTLDSTIYVATHSAGVWRSEDAGNTFEQIFNDGSRVHEIAAFKDSTLVVSVHGYGLVRINENDLTTTRLNGGQWPSNGFGRISFDYADSFPSVMYAQLATSANNALQGIYKSSDGGKTWEEKAFSDGDYRFSWYCFKLSVAPQDTNFVITLCTTEPRYTSNGGQSWTSMSHPHADYHEVTWYDNTKFLIGNDGGVHRYNKNFMSISTSLNNGLNITQFYTGSYYPTGNSIIGGTQDNGTRLSFEENQTFSRIFGGDGSFCAVNQQDETIRYVSYQNLQMFRQQDGQSNRNISSFIRGQVGGDQGVWFISPFEVNMLDGDQIYVPTRLQNFRSIDGGNTWTELTTNLPGDSYSIGLSNDENPTAYISGTGSWIYRIDSAATAESGSEVYLWDGQNRPPVGFLGATIGCIEVDPNDAGTIYCGMTNVDSDSRIWRITDANTDTPEWEDIGYDLPESLPVNWIEVDPQNGEHIIIGTDYGLYSSLDGGYNWAKNEILPNVPIDQIKLRPSDRKLYIYTHGRGIWNADLLEDPVTSVETILTPDQVKVYPNPATNWLHIESDFTSLELYDYTGNLVRSSTGKKLNTSDLAQGTYFLQIWNNKNSSVTKVVITH